MKYTIDKQEKYNLVKLHEEKLNSLIAPELKAEFVIMNSQGIKNLVLDLTDVRYCDSSGLSAVLVGNRLCKGASGSFVLTGLQDAVKKLVAISQLDSVLTITPTVNEAIDFIFMDEIERGTENSSI